MNKSKLKREITRNQAKLDRINNTELSAKCTAMVGECFKVKPLFAEDTKSFMRIEAASGTKITQFNFGENENGYLSVARCDEQYTPKVFEYIYTRISEAEYKKALALFKAKLSALV